jgi:hypothetical protein
VTPAGDVRRTYCGSVYWLRCYAAGWLLTADGVALAAPYPTREAGLAALDAVAPPG